MLLAHGADLEARLEGGRLTPLMVASDRWKQSPDGAMIRALLEGGADLEAGDINGKTALGEATMRYEQPPENIVELLTPHG